MNVNDLRHAGFRRLLGAGLGLLLSLSAQAAEVRLQLSWEHQFQFAGYYAALHKGFYRDAGIEVELLEGQTGQLALDPVLRGDAEFGVGGAELLAASMENKPIVALAGIFQNSPMVLLVNRELNINAPADLEGHKVMLQNPASSVPVQAMLQHAGVDLEKVYFESSSRMADAGTMQKYAAFSAYLSNEPYQLRQFNAPFLMLDPMHFGLDFYGDMLFTRQDYLNSNPEVVRKFRTATLLGWQYALQHPEEIIQLIRSRYNPMRSREHLFYEANVLSSLIMPDVVELGYLNPERLLRQAELLRETGLTEGQLSTDTFIYDPSPESAIERWRNIALITLGLLLILVVLGSILINLHIRLKLNIAARKEAEHAQQKERAMFEAIFFSAPFPSVVTDQERHIQMCNPAFYSTFGYTPEQVEGLCAENLYADPHDFNHITNTLYHLQNNTPTIAHEVMMLRCDQSRFPAQVQAAPIMTVEKERLGYIAVVHDLSDLKASQAAIEKMALTDSLTGLANRRLFDQRLRELLQLAQRQPLRISVALLDLDRFKPVNDTFGHPVGDKVLIAVSRTLNEVFRESDLVARIGGDEFAILMVSPADQTFSDAPLARVIQQLQKPLILDDLIIQIGASAGCASFPDDTGNLIELMKMADDALYSAKEQGRNRYILHQHSTNPA